MTGRRRQAGFTLLEILAALAILALLSLALFGALRTGALALSRVTERSGDLEAVRLAQRFVRDRLETALPLPWAGERRDSLAFDGTADRLDFVAVLPGYLDGGPCFVRLALSGGRLSVRWRRLVGGETAFDFDDAAPRVLLEIGRGARFGYFGVRRPGRPAEWANDWQDRSTLPRLVRLEAGVGWPALLVEPRLERSDR